MKEIEGKKNQEGKAKRAQQKIEKKKLKELIEDKINKSKLTVQEKKELVKNRYLNTLI